MTLLRLYRRFGAWLAILALLAGALSPTLAQAMVTGSDRADWLEVCSVSGMVWVKADTGEVSDHQPDDGSPSAVRSSTVPGAPCMELARVCRRWILPRSSWASEPPISPRPSTAPPWAPPSGRAPTHAHHR